MVVIVELHIFGTKECYDVCLLTIFISDIDIHSGIILTTQPQARGSDYSSQTIKIDNIQRLRSTRMWLKVEQSNVVN